MSKKSTAKKKRDARKAIVLRLDPEIVDALDEMAAEIDMSRNQMAAMMLKSGVKMHQGAEVSGAFDEIENHIGNLIQQQIQDTLQSGGLDLAALMGDVKPAKKTTKKKRTIKKK
eukprot:g12415.t1